MYKGSTALDRSTYVNGFHHLFFSNPALQSVFGISINAIRALLGVGNGKGDKGFFSCSKGTFFKNFSVVIKEFCAQFLNGLQVLGFQYKSLC